MKEVYEFDQLADRTIDHARKWDRALLKKKFSALPEEVIPMWIADMDFRVAPVISEAFKQVVENGAYGYTYAYDAFYQAVIDWHKRRHKNHVEKEWIMLSYGTVSTIHYFYQAFCQPNDKVVINTPVYDPFAYAARNNGLQVVTNPLVIQQDGRYAINFHQLEKIMKEEKPAVYLFCSPHNPSGRIWEKQELVKVAKLCQLYDVLFVCDEVHSELILSGSFTSCLQLPTSYYENMILLSSPNKGFNLGGLKTSYSIIPSELLRRRFQQRLKINSITSPNIFGVIGLTTAYQSGEEWLDQLVEYLRKNYEYTNSFIKKNIPEWRVIPMQASYLPWIDISETHNDSEVFVTALAEKTGVIVDPGTNYASDGQGFIRLNLGTSFDLVKEALEKIAFFVNDM